MSLPHVSVNGIAVSTKLWWSVPVTSLALLLHSEVAHADVASWIYVGGGVGRLTLPSGSASVSSLKPAIALDTGFGTEPLSPVVLGFVFKATGYVEEGLDLGLALRGTTSGYSRGQWGVALDLGVTQRFWGQTATLPTAGLSLGLPWGITLAATGGSDFDATHTVGLTLGFDWARLTAHRASGESQWKNYRLPIEERRP